ncbi:Uncharacterised protein [Hafnia alvei]|nr:Uncharacterised protein [Hafnia alvei]
MNINSAILMKTHNDILDNLYCIDANNLLNNDYWIVKTEARHIIDM